MEKNEERNIIIKRIGGYLHKVIPIWDYTTGKIISHTIKPLMVEFHPRDIMQVIVGASILAVPVAFTEEAWNLGVSLPLINILFLSLLSLVFISFFVYLNFYRFNLKGYVFEYIKRVASIYILSLLVVGVLLTIIGKCPWETDYILAIRRIIIVSFPASMSAAITDALK